MRQRWDANIVNTHLIIVTRTQIYHDMLVAVFEGLENPELRCVKGTYR